MDRRNGTALLLAASIAALLIGWHFLSAGAHTPDNRDYAVSQEGLLEYRMASPPYNISPVKLEGNSNISEVKFESRGAEIAAILRIPGPEMPGPEIERGIPEKRSIPGIVLLPGATVTKEAEQGLARRLADLGYASITLDQRNLGMVDPQGDLQLYLQGDEPAEHKMVYDALAAAMILRALPEIDRERIIYAGESNGGRFAVIACALDKEARGVLAISTCGYGAASALASAAGAIDADSARFYLSIDPESYIKEISPRPLVMIHSRNDTVIPYHLAEQTYALGREPKRLHTVGCATHGYCMEMYDALKEELEKMATKPEKD